MLLQWVWGPKTFIALQVIPIQKKRFCDLYPSIIWNQKRKRASGGLRKKKKRKKDKTKIQAWDTKTKPTCENQLSFCLISRIKKKKKVFGNPEKRGKKIEQEIKQKIWKVWKSLNDHHTSWLRIIFTLLMLKEKKKKL